MNREKNCHSKNGTFGEEMREGNQAKPVPADWVFKIKHRGAPIAVEKMDPKQFKARVVIRGQFMREGINFNDTFAPVAKQATIRSVLAFACRNACMLQSGDVETAFLTAPMDCEVYAKLPPYWGTAKGPICTEGQRGPPRLLLKGIPGIPQGSRLFFQTFTNHLRTLGLVPSPADPCLFLNPALAEIFAVILWVDDFFVAYEKLATFLAFMEGMYKKFTIPAVGPLATFLGMVIHYDRAGRRMFISQRNAIQVLLERAGMTVCNPVSTPCVPGSTFSKADCPLTVDESKASHYRSIIAMVNFISSWSRPDITFACNKLCKFMANPGEAHIKALKHLLRYLKGTLDLSLSYDFASPSQHTGVHGFTDASFGDCPDTGRSTLAYAFYYYGAIVSWYSKSNTYVTTSTNHSEYAAMGLGAKEAEWQLLLFLSLDPKARHTP
jgi:hypothetical protein